MKVTVSHRSFAIVRDASELQEDTWYLDKCGDLCTTLEEGDELLFYSKEAFFFRVKSDEINTYPLTEFTGKITIDCTGDNDG